jgi:hypothetical protein
MSNLRLLNDTTASSVASLSITDIFSSDFDIYKIKLSNFNADSSNPFLQFRFINSSGTIITSSQYNSASLYLRSWNSDIEYNDELQTTMKNLTLANSQTTADTGGAVFYIFNPFSASSYTSVIGQSQAQETSGTYSFKAIGQLKQLHSCTGLNINFSSANNVSLNVKTYGLRVDT